MAIRASPCRPPSAERRRWGLRRSQIVENALKEKIQSFGFRTWSEDGGDKKADFLVVGEPSSAPVGPALKPDWSSIDRGDHVLDHQMRRRKTGEGIYYNTAVPSG